MINNNNLNYECECVECVEHIQREYRMQMYQCRCEGDKYEEQYYEHLTIEQKDELSEHVQWLIEDFENEEIKNSRYEENKLMLDELKNIDKNNFIDKCNKININIRKWKYTCKINKLKNLFKSFYCKHGMSNIDL